VRGPIAAPALVAFALFFCAACGPDPAPGESVAEICRVENHGREVHVGGYLAPPVITLGCESSCSLYLAPDRSSQDGVFVHFPVGSGRGTMDAIGTDERMFPGEVRRIDLSSYRLRDDAGGEHSIGDGVRIGGRISARRVGDQVSCDMRAATIEPLR
jgi:predicted RNA-binding protein